MLTQKTEAGVAYGIWFYSVLIIGDISGKVSLKMRSGTFEQIYLSSIPIPMIFLSKIITSIFRAFIIMTTLLMLINLSYLGLGIFCFFLCERKAKIKGILGHY
jgi:hypothetical protein